MIIGGSLANSNPNSKNIQIKGNYIENVSNPTNSTSASAIKTVIADTTIDKNIIDNSASSNHCKGILGFTGADGAIILGILCMI